jgi:hypothetical protein
MLLPTQSYAAVSQFASHNYMDEPFRTSLPEASSADAGKWIGRVVIAVLLAEAIWGFIASITNNLLLPLLARTMGGDVQSPLYLGKGDFNVPALFTSVLELCFAGIAAVVLNSWIQRRPKAARGKVARVSPIPQATVTRPSPIAVAPVEPAVPVPPPVAATAAASAISSAMESSSPAQSPPAGFWSPPQAARPKTTSEPPPPKAPAKPAKPKPPKDVYYNIVGEPINPTEEE